MDRTPEFTRVKRQDRLRVLYLPHPYAPEVNAVEGVRSLTKRHIVNCPPAALDDFEALVRGHLERTEYRPDVITAASPKPPSP